MDDLISRQAAIVECNKRGAEHVGYAIAHLPSAYPEQPTGVQDILQYLDEYLHPIVSPDHWSVYSELYDMVSMLPSAQPDRRCVNCGRTVNNGGWYEDGRTRCPIEEHYALPKDGYCHLWEKRNVTDDDYPERREG